MLYDCFMSINIIPCNIVIRPELNVARRAVELSRRLQQSHDTLFTLQDGAYFPHVSLYMVQLKVANLDRVSNLLEGLAAKTLLPNLRATKYVQVDSYIDVEYERTKMLEELQMAVVDTINPIRDGMRQKDKERMLESTGKVRESLEKYGYRSVGELYRPHLTFTRFADGQPMVTMGTLPPTEEYSGDFSILGLFEMGENGTCVRLISEAKFRINT